MADAAPEPSTAANGFEFEVVHTLQPGTRLMAVPELKRFVEAERQWPGCLAAIGPEQIDPQDPNRYRTRTQWLDLECFVAWMVSPERAQLLRAMDRLGYSYSANTNLRGFAAWMPGSGTADPPPAWKVNLLVLLCLYPTVLVLNWLITPMGMGYSTAILIGNICSVAITGWLLVPAAQRLYTNWLSGRLRRRGNQLALVSIAALLLLSWAISQAVSG